MANQFIPSGKHGISKRFTSWFDSVNKGVGAKVLGNDQTVTGKVQSTLVDVTASVRGFDEQKGISKAGKDVRYLNCELELLLITTTSP